MIQAGDLDQRVSFQRKSRERDGAGGATGTWVEYAEVWANVRPMSGRERQNAMRQEALANYVITIRARTDILESDRIVYGGRAFNIRFSKVQPRSAWLEIETEMGAAS